MTLLMDRLRSDRRWNNAKPDGDDEAKIKEWLTTRTFPVYEISNVAQYLSESGTEFDRMECFPNVAPPHILYWLEWRSPDRLVPLTATDLTMPERVGLLVWQEAPPVNGEWTVGCHAWGMWKRRKRAEALVSWQVLMRQGGSVTPFSIPR